MIITRLNNGLGNQLFQYAAGFALATATGQELVIDGRNITGPGRPKTILEHMPVTARHGLDSELPPPRSSRLAYELWRRLGIGGPKRLAERGLGFNEKFLNAKGTQCLIGYWQSERYFAAVSTALRKEFAWKNPLPEQSLATAQEMSSVASVSVHIRRGDYLTNRRAYKMFGSLPPAFYQAAVTAIARRTPGPLVAYVFSDDLPWARENLELPCGMRFVTCNKGPDAAVNDMRLMGCCRHHVIANSTFSWWGAWLNPSDDKIIAAPKNWFASDQSINPDIVPANWLRF